MRVSCEGCPKRDHCTSICPEIEKLLPPADAKARAKLRVIDRSVVWRVQDNEHRLTPRQRLVARLYFRFGFTMSDIACVLRVRRQSVAETLSWIRKKIRKSSRKPPAKTP